MRYHIFESGLEPFESFHCQIKEVKGIRKKSKMRNSLATKKALRMPVREEKEKKNTAQILFL